MDNCKTLYQLLKALQFKETAVITCEEEGLKVTVENSHCVQATAFIEKELFSEYTLVVESLHFIVNLTVLLECLNIFGSGSMAGAGKTSLKMCYDGDQNRLILLLQENEVLTDCTIQTLEAEETLDFGFSTEEVENKIILRSDCLKDVFSDLDASSEVVEFSVTVAPQKPRLRISTFGQIGDIHVDYPGDSEVITEYTCTKTKSYRYRLSLLKSSVKSLLISEKVSMRFDKRDLLAFQYMVKTDDGPTCYIDFFCSSHVEGQD